MKIENLKEFVEEEIETISSKPRKIKRAKENMKFVMEQINKIKTDNEVSQNKAIEILYKQIREEMEEYDEKYVDIFIKQTHDSTIKYLQNNPTLIDKTYKEMKEEGIQSLREYNYSLNLKRNSKRLIREFLEIINEQMKDRDISEEFILKILHSAIGRTKIETHLKKDLIDLLVSSGKFFKEFGLIEKYIKSNNMNAPIKELKITDEQEVYKMFDASYLENLPLEELIFLNTFYQNRIQKEKTQLFEGIYYLENFDLLKSDDINKIKEIPDKKLVSVMAKRDVLDTLFLTIRDRDIEMKEIKQIVEEYKYEYEEIFNEKLPNMNNDLASEAISNMNELTSCNLNYDMKSMLLGKVLECLHNKTKINWGYIKQTPEDEEYTVLVGIDYPGYVPMTIHIPKAMFYYTLNGLEQYIVNTYIGNEDINVKTLDGKVKILPTNILYKVPDEKIKQIEKISKSIKKDDTKTKNAKFIHHVNASLKGIMPYHTKEKREQINVKSFKPDEEDKELEI